jgi:hypothetical protein
MMSKPLTRLMHLDSSRRPVLIETRSVMKAVGAEDDNNVGAYSANECRIWSDTPPRANVVNVSILLKNSSLALA